MFQYILPFGNLNNNYNGNPLEGNPYKSIYAVSLYNKATQQEHKKHHRTKNTKTHQENKKTQQ
jgi:hypothetical protein